LSAEARWLAALEERARESLAPAVLEYLLQGARDSVTSGEAVDAWGSVRFRPRVLHDVTHVDPGVTLLGHRVEVPFGVAPTTLQRAVHPEGELAMARATAEAGGVLVVSSNAGTSFADIGGTGARWWLQAYLPADRTLAGAMLDRAVESGASAVVLTVDTPVVGTKYASPNVPVVWDTVDPDLLRVNFDGGHDDEPGAEKALDLGPHDLGWLADRTGLPVVVKGVLRAEDADRCVQAGAAAVWVSNHGGRQLDRAASTASCLPDVVAAVGERAQVYVDGGIRTGLDVLAALALGADAVFLGRLPLLALVEGRDGVAALHRELLAQTVDALRLAGCRVPTDARGLAAP
jgi:4-hydroxymandelate oxidase